MSIPITELDSLVLTSGSARGDDSTVKAALRDDIDLDGGVTARIVGGTGVDLGNSHVISSLELRLWRKFPSPMLGRK